MYQFTSSTDKTSLHLISQKTEKSRDFVLYQRNSLDSLPQLKSLDSRTRLQMKAVSAVLPFRVNNYLVEDVIDWSNVPNDPIFQLTFPQPGMLQSQDLEQMVGLIESEASEAEIQAAAYAIRLRLNPHPAGQMDLNVPKAAGEAVPGMQHKYRETVLFFPSAGQTCFAYCTYCFRWPQFVGIDGLKFASAEVQPLLDYLRNHREVKSVLFTGGDPMIMRSELLRRYIEPLLTPEFEHITSIRIGTYALGYWPYRFVTDKDADDILRLFSEVVSSGRTMALMAHYSHPNLLQSDIAQKAIERVRCSGAVIRCQAPLMKHINDDPQVWSDMWRLQVKLGTIPYYMFVARDTGAKDYFELPLYRCLDIFQKAYCNVSGLGRTVRGPSMSCTPGKVLVDGVTEINGEKVFVLKFLQGRNPEWCNQVFLAKYDEQATWLNELKPAFGAKEFFFEPEMRNISETGFAQVWLDQSKLA